MEYVYGLDKQGKVCKEVQTCYIYSLIKTIIILNLIIKSSWNLTKLFYKLYSINGSTSYNQQGQEWIQIK